MFDFFFICCLDHCKDRVNFFYDSKSRDPKSGLYNNIFYQDPLDQTPFVELPAGFESPKKYLLLQKSVDGLRQSPLNFYKMVCQVGS